MFTNLKKFIKLGIYQELNFIPFHRLKKLNSEEPYLKSIDVLNYNFTFFKVAGRIYTIKPTTKKDPSKWLAVEVLNPITKRSAEGSISGNCAKGIKQEFLDYVNILSQKNLSQIEMFIHIVLNVDNLK